jgi:hypothetical protein
VNGDPTLDRIDQVLQDNRRTETLFIARGFDKWVEQQCARFYAKRMGRAGLPFAAAQNHFSNLPRLIVSFGCNRAQSAPVGV